MNIQRLITKQHRHNIIPYWDYYFQYLIKVLQAALAGNITNKNYVVNMGVDTKFWFNPA